jgi:hypothetical protein
VATRVSLMSRTATASAACRAGKRRGHVARLRSAREGSILVKTGGVMAVLDRGAAHVRPPGQCRRVGAVTAKTERGEME